jgi:hypothetical protein
MSIQRGSNWAHPYLATTSTEPNADDSVEPKRVVSRWMGPAVAQEAHQLRHPYTDQPLSHTKKTNRRTPTARAPRVCLVGRWRAFREGPESLPCWRAFRDVSAHHHDLTQQTAAKEGPGRVGLELRGSGWLSRGLWLDLTRDTG